MTRTKTAVSARALVIWISVTTLLFFTAFPFVWMLSTSFKAPTEIFAYPPYLIPKQFTLGNHAQLFEQTRFLVYFKNSVFVALTTVFLSLLIATPGAYSLTRFRFYGREKIAGLVLFTYMFAPIMIIIPFFVTVKFLGIANTHFALILSYTAFSLPFSLWMLRTFFQSIPLDLEEAALTDGAGRFQAVVYVLMPMAMPGIIATGIFTFILAWNDYIFVRILITSDRLKTLPVGMADLYNATVIDWGMIMAGSMLIIVPVIIVFVHIQRYLIAGWGAGAVKG